MVAPRITIDARLRYLAPRQHWRSKQVAPLRKRPQPSGIHKHFITIHLRTIRALVRELAPDSIYDRHDSFIPQSGLHRGSQRIARGYFAGPSVAGGDRFAATRFLQPCPKRARSARTAEAIALSPACGEPGHPGHARLGTFPQSKACPITAAMRPPRRTNDARG